MCIVCIRMHYGLTTSTIGQDCSSALDLCISAASLVMALHRQPSRRLTAGATAVEQGLHTWELSVKQPVRRATWRSYVTERLPEMGHTPGRSRAHRSGTIAKSISASF